MQDKGHYPALVRSPLQDSMMKNSRQDKELRPLFRAAWTVPAVPVGAEALIRQDWCAQSQEVAGQWQVIGVWAELWELATVRSGQPGRAHELVGVMASAGEQLSLIHI